MVKFEFIEMGVKGLQSYVENECSGKACYRVSIAKTIQSFVETSCPSETPLVLVDTSSLLRPLFEGLDWICGGQFSECARRVKEFVDTFHSAGAKLIFFFDGPCQIQKRDEWIKRRVQNYYRVQQLMARLLKGESVLDVDAFLLPSGINHFVRYVITQECKCEAITSKVECDEEIAAYARQHASRVLGIVSQDSDYIIFNAAPYYFSAKHLDMTDFTTVVYDSVQFAKMHNCSVEWLPVLGTLMGNDVLSPELLRGFHRRITGWRKSGHPRHKLIIPAVVKIIRAKLDRSMSVDDVAKVLQLEIFTRYEHETFNAVFASLKMFMMLSDPNCGRKVESKYLNELLQELMSCFNFHSVSAKVIVYRCVDQSNAMEDLTSQFTPTTLVYRPMDSRIYGVLLKSEQHRLVEPYHLQEYAVYSEHSVKRPSNVAVIFPPFDLDLLALVRSGDSSGKVSEKLKLLFWMLCVDDVMSQYHSETERLFLRVEPKFTIPALVLFTLHKVLGILLETEVELFLTLILFLDLGSYDKDITKRPCSRPDYNAVHLATLFVRGVQCVHRILAILGPMFPSFVFSNANFFDGVLFQHIFSGKLKRDHLEMGERENLILQSLRDFIFTPLMNPKS